MNGKIVAGFLQCVLAAAICLAGSEGEPLHHDSGRVTILVKQIDRVSPNEVHFRLTLQNATAWPVFLEGRALGVFVEQLYLEQWKEGVWHRIVPCLENAPSSVLTLGPGKKISQDRVLTDPVEAPCKGRLVQLEGMFRFRLEYFLSEREAKANEKNFELPDPNHPPPKVAVSASFEIPIK